MNEKILIVDDDAEIAQLVSVYLKKRRFSRQPWSTAVRKR